MNEERKKKLLRRVEKLLRQSEGTTYAAEAETALLLAQRILCENGMRMEEVSALSAEEQKKLVDNAELVNMGHTHSNWLLSLSRVIVRNFRCRHYVHHTWTPPCSHQIRIVGLADDVAIARDVYLFARTEAERLAKAYAKQPGVIENHLYQRDPWRFFSEWSPAKKAAASREVQRIWREGFVEGLAHKFAEQLKRSESLAVLVVIHPVVQDAYRNLGLRNSTYKPQSNGARNEDAQRAGFAAGKQFEAKRPERIAAPLPRLGSGS